jgi:hypothetical protein
MAARGRGTIVNVLTIDAAGRAGQPVTDLVLARLRR